MIRAVRHVYRAVEHLQSVHMMEEAQSLLNLIANTSLSKAIPYRGPGNEEGAENEIEFDVLVQV